MQISQKRLNKIISFVLSFLMLFATIQIINYKTEGDIVYAFTDDDIGGTGPETKPSDPTHEGQIDIDTQHNPNTTYDPNKNQVGNDDTVGLQFKNIVSGGSNDISKSGVYLDDSHDDYLYMYVTAKKKASSKFYRTIGFYVTTEKHSGAQPSEYLYIPIKYGSEIKPTYTGNGTTTALSVPDSISGIMKSYKNNMDIKFENVGSSFSIPNGAFKQYEDDIYDNDGVPYIGTCFRILKSDLYLAFAPDIVSKANSNSNLPLYLSSVNVVQTTASLDASCSNAQFVGPLCSKDATINAVTSQGFSAQSKEDIKNCMIFQFLYQHRNSVYPL